MSVTDSMVGGNHYREGGIQPIQYIHANNLNFFEGNVVKYTTRHRNKNGIQDLKKAVHYLQMILEFEYDLKSKVTYETK